MLRKALIPSFLALLVILPLLCVLPVGCATTTAPDYIEGHDRGRREFQLENYAEAKVIFNELLREYPDGHLSQSMKLYVASCDFAMGDVDDARRVYHEILGALENTPRKVPVLLSLGDLELQAGNYRVAASTFQQARDLDKNPDTRRRIDFRLAVCLQQSGDFEPARRIFRQIVRDEPRTDEAEKAKIRLQYPDFFTVQVGAYGRRKNAEKQRLALTRAGFAAQIEPLDDGKRKLYRVWVGRFDRREEARRRSRRVFASDRLPAGSRAIVIP